MWTPKQLLTDEAVEKLRHAGFTETEIELLGWYSGIAFSINNSRNPSKAALTNLAKPKTAGMIKEFDRRKKEATAPALAPEMSEVQLRENRKALDRIAKRETEIEAEATPKASSADAS